MAPAAVSKRNSPSSMRIGAWRSTGLRSRKLSTRRASRLTRTSVNAAQFSIVRSMVSSIASTDWVAPWALIAKAPIDDVVDRLTVQGVEEQLGIGWAAEAEGVAHSGGLGQVSGGDGAWGFGGRFGDPVKKPGRARKRPGGKRAPGRP